jgi:hypothetical protein
MHVVLVQRRSDGQLVLVETQAGSERRFTVFDLPRRGSAIVALPAALRGPVRLVLGGGGRLRQFGLTDPVGFSTVSGEPVVFDSSVHALLDPAGSTRPGMDSGSEAVGSAGGRESAGAAAEAASAPNAIAWNLELEFLFGHPAGPAEVQRDERDEQLETRVNPFWTRLADLPPSAVLSNRNVDWIFAVDADGGIRVGAEMPEQLLSGPVVDDLLPRIKAHEPDLTREKLLDLLSTGHPTVAVDFDEWGRTVVRPARFGGELHFDATTGHWQISDLSGRFMQPAVRDYPLPRDVEWWMANVAERFSHQLGVPVRTLPPSAVTHEERRMPTDDNRRQQVKRQAQAIVAHYPTASQADRARIAAAAEQTLLDFNAPISRALDVAGKQAEALGLPAAVEIQAPVTPPTADEQAVRELDLRIALGTAYLGADMVRRYRDWIASVNPDADPASLSSFAMTHAFLNHPAADVFRDLLDVRSPDREIALAAADLASHILDAEPPFTGTAYVQVRAEDVNLLPGTGGLVTIPAALVATTRMPDPAEGHTVLVLDTQTALDTNNFAEGSVVVRPDTHFTVAIASGPGRMTLTELPTPRVAGSDSPAVYTTGRLLDVGQPVTGVQIQLPAADASRYQADLKPGADNLTFVIHRLVATPVGAEQVRLDPHAVYVVGEVRWDDAGRGTVEVFERVRSTRAARVNQPAEMPWLPMSPAGPLTADLTREPDDARLITGPQTNRLRWQRLRLVPSARLTDDSLNSVLDAVSAGALVDVSDHSAYLSELIEDDGSLTPEALGLPEGEDIASALDGPDRWGLVPALVSRYYELAVVVVRPDGSMARFTDPDTPDRPTIVLVQTEHGLHPVIPEDGLSPFEPGAVSGSLTTW